MENNELNVNVEENNELMEYEESSSTVVSGLIGMGIGFGLALVGKKVVGGIKKAWANKKESKKEAVADDDNVVAESEGKIVDDENK